MFWKGIKYLEILFLNRNFQKIIEMSAPVVKNASMNIQKKKNPVRPQHFYKTPLYFVMTIRTETIVKEGTIADLFIV